MMHFLYSTGADFFSQDGDRTRKKWSKLGE